MLRPITLPLTLQRRTRLIYSAMPPRKRAADDGEPPRRSSRRVSAREDGIKEEEPAKSSPPAKKAKVAATPKTKPTPKPKATPKAKAAPKVKATAEEGAAPAKARAMSPDPPFSSIPRTNPDAPRHDGEWYWLMKAEPETRMENGVDVRFSIDDLRAKTVPEGWDGIRAYAGK